MLGPIYGGAIVELSGWRWIFWLNVPQAALLFLALFRLPNRPDRGIPVDFAGGVLLAAALLMLSLAVSRGSLFAGFAPLPIALLGLGLLLTAALVVYQAKAKAPLLPPVRLSFPGLPLRQRDAAIGRAWP